MGLFVLFSASQERPGGICRAPEKRERTDHFGKRGTREKHPGSEIPLPLEH